MQMKKIVLIILYLSAALLGCQKDFLGRKPSKALLVPATLADFQALLDNNGIMNKAPTYTLVAADDYYTTDKGLAALGTIERNSYLWAQDVYAGATSADWDKPYQQVFYANVVLDGLKNLQQDSASLAAYDLVKGSALFYRAFAYYGLAQEFTVPYDPATAGKVPGLPLHVTSDVNLRPGRGNLQQTYAQVLGDLQAAAALLPLNPGFKSRPGRPAAYALLARVYLAMQDYPHARAAADACLALDGALLDYNMLNAAATRPYPAALPDGNDEVLFYSAFSNLVFTSSSSTLTLVDSGLYRSYAPGDLRKAVFFRDRGNGVVNFKGSYSGGGLVTLFAGIATDEVYLVRAECAARSGDAASAMADLNTLLAKRWLAGTFVPLASAGADDALAQVLAERRKELFSRGLRWGDLRRLNQDSRFAVTLMRVNNGTVVQLPPGDPRYTFPVPDDELRNSGISQNPR